MLEAPGARKGGFEMRILIAAVLMIICIPNLVNSEESKIHKFAPDTLIEAQKFNENFTEIEDQIKDLKKSLEDTQNRLARLQKTMIPKGTVAAFTSNECPTGWSPFEEAAGRVILGAGAGKGLTPRYLMQKGGEEKHKLTIAEMPKHKHTWTGVRADKMDDRGFGGSERNVHRASGTVNDISQEQGGDQPHENMPPFIALRFCRKD